MMKKELSGKVALITGGSSGIGKATAIRFAQEGAKVVILARRIEKLEIVSCEIAGLVGEEKVLPIQTDVSDEAQVRSAFRKTMDVFKQIDIVVCNAGYLYSSPVEETTLEEWTQVYGTNVVGSFLVSREAFRHWKNTRIPGSLIFVSSKNAISPSAQVSAYCSAKAATLHLARCLAVEGAPYGIRVNSVLPDAVIKDSEMFSPERRKQVAQRYGIRDEEIETFYRNRNLLKVSIFPEDVAEAILFFAGNRGGKTTGAILPVDGGIETALAR
jgi:NAD(P)-dependent dehydrogenase (short-subunit alcohol dehydrogenase family)